MKESPQRLSVHLLPYKNSTFLFNTLIKKNLILNDRDQILKIGQKTIEIELETLRDLKQDLGKHFVDCVEELFACEGRVIITGVGKSALVAKKIVATFNSTGTPALYMHAADAVHGDLGMITSEDCIICLSKSGETSEIKVLIPILRNFGNKLIGISANKQSYLGQNVDHLLHIPVTREAEPNRLAPTASTLAQMAMGDALASALLKLRGFSHEHFARFHPGGSLGKQLYLRVRDVYPNNEIPSVGMDAPIRDVIIEMTSKRLGVAVILDDSSKIKGIITDGDLRRMLNKYKNSEDLRASDVMSINPKTIGPLALAVEAFRIMQKNSITQIIVAENEHYLGIVHIHDLIREGIV